MLMMMRSDDNATVVEGCTAEELLACIAGDNYDECVASCGSEEEPTLPGYATVSTRAESNQTVAKNAVSKKIGTITLRAGENDTTVSSIVISKTGLGSGTVTFELAKNGVSASKQGVLRNNKNSVTVRFSPVLTLKANSSETFDVLASFDAAENSNFDFAVSDVNVANGKSSGTPASLGTVSTTSYSVAAIAAADITVTAGASQKAGELNKTMATVRIVMPSRETKLDGFVITNENTTEDLTDLVNNVKAYVNGQEVGKVTVSNEKIVVSNLNITRANGESVSIELKDDAIFVGNTYQIDLNINENDIVAYETSTNERIHSAANTGAKLTINGIDLSINNETTASKTVAPGTSSVELLNVKMTANTDFEITDYAITFDAPASVTMADLKSGFNTLTAYINGADYELDLDGSKTGWTFDKKDSVNISKTSPVVVRVVGNVKSEVTTTPPVFTLHFTATTGRNDNNTLVPINNIDIAGHTTTINNGGFTLSRQSDTPTNKTVTEGTAENMLYFNLRANAEDQILTGLTVNYTGTVATLSGIATKAELMKGNTVVKSVTDASKLGATVVFEGLSEPLKMDEDNYFTVRVTLKGGEVSNLGNTGALSITTGNVKVARAANTAIATTTTSPNFVGATYYVSSKAPSVEITDQVAKNTTIKFTNNSSYYVVLESVKLEMTKNLVNGTYVNWNGTGILRDSINGNKVSTDEKVIPGEAEWNLTAGLNNLDSTLNYVVELFDPADTVNSENYTVTVKSVKYHFVDKTDSSKVSKQIEETYNVTENK